MWKKEYAERRRRKYGSDASERERRKRQGRTTERNREYMQSYYKKNKSKWRLSEAQREERNAKRRERYSKDSEYREKCKAFARRRPSESRRDSVLRKNFGISSEEYDRMLAGQGGKCAICGSIAADDRKYRLHVDHCHVTGRVRGILCGNCNLGLGKFKDDINLVEAAYLYLRRNQDTSRLDKQA